MNHIQKVAIITGASQGIGVGLVVGRPFTEYTDEDYATVTGEILHVDG